MSFAFPQICQKSVTVLLVLFVSCAFGIDPSPDDDKSLLPSSEHQRTMISIVWSCLATIFACTWLSVHPNVPGRTITSKGWFAGASERVKVMIIAILAPESMVGWAADQYMVAWEVHHGEKFSISSWITDQYMVACRVVHHGKKILSHLGEGIKTKFWGAGGEPQSPSSSSEQMCPNLDQNESWPDYCVMRPSMADGFFLSMGGFYCAKQVPSTPPEPLKASTRIVTVSLFNKELGKKLEGISPYSISEMIADKNKGDALSKTVSVLQISWFIAQCISRVVQRLHITLLEITAVAFAGLSIITYCLWWHKPLNVKHHILVHVGTESEDKIEYPTTPESEQPNSDTDTVGALEDFFWWMAAHGFGDSINSFKDNGTGKEEIRDIKSGAFRFSSGARYERPIGRVVIVMLVGTIFGAFHCTAWSFQFPSYAERVLWQFSCLGLLTGILTEGILLLVEPACELIIGELSPTFRKAGEAFVTGGSWVTISTYTIARIILLVLAFMELRSLPPLAFRNVQWTTYIPHI